MVGSGLNERSGAASQHFDDVFSEGFLNLSMPGNRLGNFSLWILVPVVTCAMTNQEALKRFDYAN